VSLAEDKACGGEVQRKAEHGCDEENRRERAEFERLLNEKRRHQHKHREGNRDGERKVEQEGGQRQDQYDDDRHDAQGEREIAALGNICHQAARRHAREAETAEQSFCGGGAASVTHSCVPELQA